MEFIKNFPRVFLIISVILLLVIGIRILKKVISHKQQKKELRQVSADKIRDENLNNIILNNLAENGSLKEAYRPYEVDYSNSNAEGSGNAGKREKTGESRIMLQLVEKTELSTRKFVLNPAKTIRIGSNLQDNDISVLTEGIFPKQCEIFAFGSKIYVRNLSTENNTVIKRKKERAIVDKKGIRLLTNDIIIIGKVSYDVTIID